MGNFSLVFTVCECTCLGVSSLQRSVLCILMDLSYWFDMFYWGLFIVLYISAVFGISKLRCISVPKDFVSAGSDEMLHSIVFHLGIHCLPEYLLTIFILDTNKQVLWQTMKTQMKCRIWRHIIRVCKVC